MVNRNSGLISRLAFVAGIYINIFGVVGCNPPPEDPTAEATEADASLKPDANTGGTGGSGGSAGTGGDTGGTEPDATTGGASGNGGEIVVDMGAGGTLDLSVNNHEDQGTGGTGGVVVADAGTGGNTGGTEPDAAIVTPDAATFGPPCARDNDCGLGEVCNSQSICVPGCRSDNDCVAEEHCSVAINLCVADALPGIPGPPGQDGTDGESCRGEQDNDGCMVFTCGDRTFPPMCSNGCIVTDMGDCSLITCDVGESRVCNGQDAQVGQQCSTLSLVIDFEDFESFVGELLCDGVHMANFEVGECNGEISCQADRRCEIPAGGNIGWCSFIECQSNADCGESQVCDMGVCWLDQDGDEIPDSFDNCPERSNANQADVDEDWHGDLCDNCRETYNYSQVDMDNDGIGDACEQNPPVDRCPEMTCNAIPASICDGNVRVTYTSSCLNSTCSYPAQRSNCANGCSNGVCLSPPVDNDLDNDGFDNIPSGGNDCNDNNAAIHPGANEICGNGVNEDCQNGDLVCPSPDQDRDGFTIAEGDCDDNNNAVNPGAEETCGNNVDEDCDGNLAPACVVNDADGDGFTVAEGDCNDADRFVNPDQAEVCGDGPDNDCSGGDLACPPQDICTTLRIRNTWQFVGAIGLPDQNPDRAGWPVGQWHTFAPNGDANWNQIRWCNNEVAAFNPQTVSSANREWSLSANAQCDDDHDGLVEPSESWCCQLRIVDEIFEVSPESVGCFPECSPDGRINWLCESPNSRL